MLETLITALPALIALFVCIRRGPERALVDVYLPTLLLLPAGYHWWTFGQLTLTDTAIIPIAGFVIALAWRDWKWSFTDLLVIGFVTASVISGWVNKGFAEAHSLTLQLTCSTIFPYIVAKGIRPREGLYVELAKRFVMCVTIVAIIDVYEFRMGVNLFNSLFAHLYPGQGSTNWQGRYGFDRTTGPYAHSILAGIVFATAYRLNQWLKWGKYRTEKSLLRPSKWTLFCQLWLIAGSVMTLSRGPWVGAGFGALVVWIGRSRKRLQTLFVTLTLVLVVGIPVYHSVKSYVSVGLNATDEMEQTAAYRRELLQEYIGVVEERPAWGWGRNNYPVVEGMESIDNEYLLLALDFGEYVLAFFILILLLTMTRLVIFCWSHHGSTFPGSVALTLLGIYVLIVISIATAYLGGQTYPLFFFFSGWSDALLLAPALLSGERVQPVKFPRFKFRRVLA